MDAGGVAAWPAIVTWPPRSVRGVPGAVVLDLDGTLVDTVHLRVEGWTAAFEELGIRADPAILRRLIGADGHVGARAGVRSAGQEPHAALEERLDYLAGEAFGWLNQSPRPLSGATELLTALARQGIPHAIATASRAAQVLTSVDALGLASRPLIVDGSHVRHAKPAPDLLLLAARRLRTPPKACWYVGDSIWDMQAARAGRMTAAGVTSGFATADDLRRAGADIVGADLDDLRVHIEGATLAEGAGPAPDTRAR